MTEYIEREAAIKLCNDLSQDGFLAVNTKYMTDMLSAIPAADVAPVVRCKDCKHSYEDLCGRVCSYGVSVDCVVPDDFFCADGAKMEVE